MPVWAKYNRRSFDYDWLKSEPIFAQDDSILVLITCQEDFEWTF